MAVEKIEVEKQYGAMLVTAWMGGPRYKVECTNCGESAIKTSSEIRRRYSSCRLCAPALIRKRMAYERIGRTRGAFTITDVVDVPDDSPPVYEVMCGYCGGLMGLTSSQMGSWRDCGCGTGCSRGGGHARRDSLIDVDVPWEEDELCREFVDANPRGMVLDQIGALIGMTREAVRLIEMRAKKNFAAALCREIGLSEDEICHHMMQRTDNGSPIARCQDFADLEAA